MANEITLDTLLSGGGAGVPAEIKPTDIETVNAQVEQLSPEQLARAEELKNSIDLTDSQTALQYGVGAQRNISGFSENILSQVKNKDSGFGGDLNPAQSIKDTYCTGGTSTDQTDLTDSTQFAIIAVYDAAGAGQYWIVGNGDGAQGDGTSTLALNGTPYTITWDLEW